MSEEKSMVKGVIVRGRSRGASLGYPTANIDVFEGEKPEFGVYAVKIKIEGEDFWRNGAASLGKNPTFDDEKTSLEVHIFDFNADIYEKTAEVEFVEFLRNEMKFNSVEELVAKIDDDCAKAREILK